MQQMRSTQQAAAGPGPDPQGPQVCSQPQAAAAAEADDDEWQQLPPLQSAEIFPRLVKCHATFIGRDLRLVRCPARTSVGHIDGRVPITLSMTWHSADWDADAYVRSCEAQLNPSGQGVLPTPTAAGVKDSQPLTSAAGSGRGHLMGSSRPQSDAGVATCGPFNMTAQTTEHGTRLRGLSQRDVPASVAGEAYDVVLQEQVGCEGCARHGLTS